MSILVFTENWDGRFKKLSFELLTFAKKVAAQAGGDVIALSIGKVPDEALAKLAAYGGDRIIKVEDDRLSVLVNKAYSAVIAQVAAQTNANVIVFAHNFTGKALAPRIAVKMNAGLVTGVTEVPAKLDPFTVKKKVFTNKAFANVEVKSAVKVLTLFQNSVGVEDNPGKGSVESFTPQLSDKDFLTKVVEVNKVTGKVLLTDAEIVISGGRGMKSPDKWAPLEELSGLLGAAMACSRPVSDEGWRPHAEHVGQTGKIIAPNLYFALGISGAIQHLGGVSSSKCIVAVNTDKDAPIFEAADYGIVGDVHTVLPELVKAVRDLKESQG